MQSVLSGGLFDGSTTSLLEAGRANMPGIGLSARARSLTSSYLQQSRGSLNALLSAGTSSGVEGLQKQILALRASLSDTQLATNLRRGDTVQLSATRSSFLQQDSGQVTSSSRGNNLNIRS